MLTVLLFALPALAQSEYPALYKETVRGLQSACKRQYIAVMDITGSGTPELIHLGVGASGDTKLNIYCVSGGTVKKMRSTETLFDFDAFSVKGLRSYGFEFRASGSTPCLSVLIRSVASGVKFENRVAFVPESATALKPVYQQALLMKGRTVTQRVSGGNSVTSAQYKSYRARFVRAYPKKGGSLKVYAVSATESAASIDKKINALCARYTKAVTLTKITLTKSSASVMVGATTTIGVKRTPTTAIYAPIAFAATDSSIAKISGAGVIEGVKYGTTTVYATSGALSSKRARITVKTPVPTKVTLDKTSAAVLAGGTYPLTATVYPATAATTLKFTSSEPSVATVSDTGLIKGVKTGSATITVKTGNGKYARCKVKVLKSTQGVIVDISEHNYSSKLDWAKIAQNVDLLILRCGVTRTYTAPIGIGIDNKFAYFAKKCKAYDIPFGVYYYGKVSTAQQAEKEAEMAYKTASPYDPLFYVYDCEESMLNKTIIQTFVSRIKELGAKKTGLYIAHHLYATYKVDPSIVDFIWIPHYGKNTGLVNSAPSYACDLHQYTSVGRIAGFPGNIDVNRLTGTKGLSWFLE